MVRQTPNQATIERMLVAYMRPSYASIFPKSSHAWRGILQGGASLFAAEGFAKISSLGEANATIGDVSDFGN